MQVLAWFFPVFEGLFLGLIAAALHEGGHLVAAVLVGVKVKSIGFRWKGLYTVRESGPPMKNLLISLAGPCTNLALVGFWPLSHLFGLANLCFAFVNILPIEGSDGERVMRCWSLMKKESSRLSQPIAESGFSEPRVAQLVSQSKPLVSQSSPQCGD
jgi:Zn-dependent protease